MNQAGRNRQILAFLDSLDIFQNLSLVERDIGIPKTGFFQFKLLMNPRIKTITDSLSGGLSFKAINNRLNSV